jgi:hypothetical protein
MNEIEMVAVSIPSWVVWTFIVIFGVRTIVSLVNLWLKWMGL